MTNRQFLDRLVDLTNRLCEAQTKHGYGTAQYVSIHDEIKATIARFSRSRRLRPAGETVT